MIAAGEEGGRRGRKGGMVSRRLGAVVVMAMAMAMASSRPQTAESAESLLLSIRVVSSNCCW